MKKAIDLEALLTPIPGEDPAGDDLRYTDVYEQIKEARRYDDPLDQGEWKTELKTADWEEVISLGLAALSARTKDLQIAAWLTEGLIMTEGFDGLAAGLALTHGLLDRFWDSLYPRIEEDDLEYRIAPLEFMNEKFWVAVTQVPVTDPGRTSGYSLLKWQESRAVGYETDTRNKYGDTDEGKQKRRDEQIQEGKLTAEEFDAAQAASPPAFYASLRESLAACTDSFTRLDALVDERFGKNAPRLAELGKAIGDCAKLVDRIFKEKGGTVSLGVKASPVPEPASPVSSASSGGTRTEQARGPGLGPETEAGIPWEEVGDQVERVVGEASYGAPTGALGIVRPGSGSVAPNPLVDASPWEQKLWEEADRTMGASGITKALEQLLEASLMAPSVRERTRCKLLVGKLCLSAERPDLARPILEQLYATVEQLQLEQWESPVWIADVIGSLYQCLVSGEPTDDDYGRAQVLFQRLCTIDITKAVGCGKTLKSQ